MSREPATHLFILGKDYHLGDLLWFTTVLSAYRQHIGPARVIVACPRRPISLILERHPLIDELVLYDPARPAPEALRAHRSDRLVVHDLRPLPIAVAMLRRWCERRPWLYLRDLWLAERGQWLATFLRLGQLEHHRPLLRLDDADRAGAMTLQKPYALLAPRIGRYTFPLLGRLWRHVKTWDEARWMTLAETLRAAGYEPYTLAATGQVPIAGTGGLTGLPIRRVAGLIEGASILISVESGLWYIAAALGRPFVIVPWWLPRSIDWAAPMQTPYRLIHRDQTSVHDVVAQVRDLLAHDSAPARHDGDVEGETETWRQPGSAGFQPVPASSGWT